MAKCIVISGMDGSGKSTIIARLMGELENDGKSVVYVWLRFNHYLTKVMHALARVLGLSVKVENEMGRVWVHRLYKSPHFCGIYVLAVYLDTWISRLKYERAAKKRDIVVCDRWIPDIVVDLAIKTRINGFLESAWVKRFSRIMPEDAKLYMIQRAEAKLLECRTENRIDADFTNRLDAYSIIGKRLGATIVNNDGTVDRSVEQILKSL